MTFLNTIGAVATAVALIPSPAAAQHRGGGGGGGHAQSGGGGGGGHAQSGGGGHAVSHGAAVPRSYGAPRTAGAPRVYSSASRPMAAAPRSYAYGGSRGVYAAQRGHGAVGGHAVPRPAGAYPNHYYRPYYPYHYPGRYYRPYYSFYPHFSVGFGLWVGYPFAYAGYYYPYYAYPYPYPYGYSYPYPAYGYPYPANGYPANGYPANGYPANGYPANGYPANGYPAYPQAAAPSTSVGVQTGQANTGGISFDITPADAELLVDGQSVGRVGDFTPNTEPLGLTPGRHHIEIHAAGFRTMAFDVDVVAGQVIPYRGALQR
jgi:hypothetical protein